jgi:AcrR family transcriptional regulator
MATTDRPPPLTGRAAAIKDAARELLEEEGPDGLAMRALAHRVGAHPPAVYRHFADKSAIEAAVVSEGLTEIGDEMLTALRAAPAGGGLEAVARAYHDWAMRHPHLYRLTMGRPLPPAVDEDAEFHAGKAVREVAGGDVMVARALWACVHGLTIIELDGRLPAGSDIDAIWAFALGALGDRLGAKPAPSGPPRFS